MGLPVILIRLLSVYNVLSFDIGGTLPGTNQFVDALDEWVGHFKLAAPLIVTSTSIFAHAYNKKKLEFCFQYQLEKSFYEFVDKTTCWCIFNVIFNSCSDIKKKIQSDVKKKNNRREH